MEPRHADAETVIRWLRRAHAGELGAALAYRGHWRSLRDPREAARIRTILGEELAHRREALALLRRRGGTPDRTLGRLLAWTGRLAGWACFRTGYLMPMLGAALAERINIGEYQALAEAAERCGDTEAFAFARRARAAEADHARFFLDCAARHGLRGLVAGWLLDPAAGI